MSFNQTPVVLPQNLGRRILGQAGFAWRLPSLSLSLTCNLNTAYCRPERHEGPVHLAPWVTYILSPPLLVRPSPAAMDYNTDTTFGAAFVGFGCSCVYVLARLALSRSCIHYVSLQVAGHSL